MFKPLLLAGVLLAQALPPAVPMPLPPMGTPSRFPRAAGPSDGISVAGNGYASAAATKAVLVLHVSSRTNGLTLDAQTLAPVIDALVKAGVPRSDVSLPAYLVGQAHTNNVAITATVHNPSAAMLQSGMVTVANAFASLRDVLLNGAEIRVSTPHCAQLTHAAEAAALRNARDNAAFIATQLHVHLAHVLAVSAYGPPSVGPAACTTTSFIGPYGPAVPASSPAEMLEVKAYSNVSMRFAIRP